MWTHLNGLVLRKEKEKQQNVHSCQRKDTFWCNKFSVSWFLTHDGAQSLSVQLRFSFLKQEATKLRTNPLFSVNQFTLGCINTSFKVIHQLRRCCCCRVVGGWWLLLMLWTASYWQSTCEGTNGLFLMTSKTDIFSFNFDDHSPWHKNRMETRDKKGGKN